MKNIVDTVATSAIYAGSNGSSKHDPFDKMTWNNLAFSNRGFAWCLHFDKKKYENQVQADIEKYNDWLSKVVSLDGFKEYFFARNSYVCLKDIGCKWGNDAKILLENIPHVCFSIPFIVYDGYLWDHFSGTKYQGYIAGTPVTVDFVILNGKVLEEKNLIELWNIKDAPRDDFNFGVWEFLDFNNLIPLLEDDENEGFINPYKDYGEHYVHDDDDSSYAMIEKCTKLLEKMGYIKRYLLKPDREDVRWQYYFQSTGTVEYGLLDTSFTKDKLVMEKIKLMLAPSFYRESGEYGPIYFLTNKENKQYISECQGIIGGHRKLKIYGRLDCSSANRYVAKGQYVRHRVFFKDEETAIAAGYRPCGKCMPEAYRKWKENKKH